MYGPLTGMCSSLFSDGCHCLRGSYCLAHQAWHKNSCLCIRIMHGYSMEYALFILPLAYVFLRRACSIQNKNRTIKTTALQWFLWYATKHGNKEETTFDRITVIGKAAYWQLFRGAKAGD